MKSTVVTDENGMAEIISLLKKNNLPYQDVKLAHNLFLRYDGGRGELLGAGGLEFYHHDALLRSLAVDERERGKSLGTQIVRDLLVRAKAESVTRVFLFTETARDFFIKLGFMDVPRSEVPEEVKASTEFTGVCPVSAACMMYQLR
jgi:amino-acid N-acetyltransferase